MKGVKVLVLTAVAMLLAGTVWSAELAGCWSFDENQGTVAKTSAVSGYDGEIHGAKWVPGKVGSALEFNGESDYVEIKDTAKDSPFALTSMSISAWIKPSAYPAGRPIYWAGIAGKRYGYGMRLGIDGRLHFRVYGPFGDDGKVTPFDYRGKKDKQISLNKWHHVVVTYDNTNTKFYIDGRLDSIYKENRLPDINKQSIFIGRTDARELAKQNNPAGFIFLLVLIIHKRAAPNIPAYQLFIGQYPKSPLNRCQTYRVQLHQLPLRRKHISRSHVLFYVAP
jgi:hypothetical protein